MKTLHRILIPVFLSFLLGIHQGNIALWKDDDPEPIRVFPFSASLLPQADRNALAQGIRVENEDALLRLLQDFLS